MGNITNLATTGNYANEVNGLVVQYNFVIDNEEKKFTSLNGSVKEITENESDGPIARTALATFYLNANHHEVKDGMNMILAKGREIELATIIVDAIEALEAKIRNGEAVQTAV